MDFAEGGLDLGLKVVAGGVDGVKESALAVVIDEGEGLLGVDFEAVADGGGVVVLAGDEGGAAGVADALDLGGEGGDVEGGGAGGADAAAGDAGDEDVVGDFEEEGAAEVDALALEEVGQDVSLGDVAREAVEEEDVGGGVGVEILGEELSDDGVGDEVAGRSPVERWRMPGTRASSAARVPLPEPGAPRRMTTFMVRGPFCA